MKLTHSCILCAVILGLAGWPSTDFSDIGKSLIDSTGVVSGSQVDALLKAGGKLSQATSSLNDEQEYYLGRSVSALILKQYPLYRGNPALTHYVNLVGNALAARSSRPEIFGGYHFGVLDTDEINALSAPGGLIFVSRGFLSIVQDEESLAGILAHEIGHVVLGHGVKAISQARLSEAALIIGKEAASSYGPSELNAVTDAFGDSVNQVFETLIKNGYSRTQEYEADDFAAKLLVKTGYSTSGLTSMLDGIAKVNAKSRGGWLDTHPAPADRKKSLRVPKQNLDPDGIQHRTARFKLALK